MSEHETPLWWLLIHQIPPKPAYLRVKIGRRLHRVGAVALKNTVYVLPHSEETQEDLEWVLREVRAGGGEAALCEARFVDGMTNTDVEKLFRDARDADYDELASEIDAARELFAPGSDSRQQAESELARLTRRFDEIAEIDFFAAPGRWRIGSTLGELRQALGGGEAKPAAPSPREAYLGKVWVTRAGVHVDRIASAWLVRRFLDSNARFKFVPPKNYQPLAGEVRFDMFDAEFTHVGDACTFEVLMQRFEIDAEGLQPIAEIVHDIDIKDAKFDRAETNGVAGLFTGIALGNDDDEARLDRGFALLDQLLTYFARAKADPARSR